MSATSDWFEHFDACPRCSMWRACRAGAPLLAAYVDATAVRMAPMPEAPVQRKVPIVVLDLARHREECKKCKPLRLCSVAVNMREQAGADIEMAGERWATQKMGRA